MAVVLSIALLLVLKLYKTTLLIKTLPLVTTQQKQLLAEITTLP